MFGQKSAWLVGTHVATAATITLLLPDRRKKMLFACACFSNLRHAMRQGSNVDLLERQADCLEKPKSLQDTLNKAAAHYNPIVVQGHRTNLEILFDNVYGACQTDRQKTINTTFLAGSLIGVREEYGRYNTDWYTENDSSIDHAMRKQWAILKTMAVTVGVWSKCWNTANVVAVADKIYNEKRWQDCPILADALEDAAGPQWALDELRSKETPWHRGNEIIDLTRRKE